MVQFWTPNCHLRLIFLYNYSVYILLLVLHGLDMAWTLEIVLYRDCGVKLLRYDIA